MPMGWHPKFPVLPGITAQWCLEVGHVTLSGNQWGPLPMLDGVPDSEYLARAVYGLYLILDSPVWGRLRQEGAISLPGGALQHATAYSGWGFDAVVGNAVQIAWDDYAWSLWIFCRYGVLVFLQQFLWMVSIDTLGDRGWYADPLTTWFLGVAHYVDGSRWSQSLLGDVWTTELLCGAHWNVWLHLQSSSWFAAYPFPSLCRR